MRSRLVWLLVMAGVATLVGVLVPSAGASQRGARRTALKLIQSCYPGNAFPVDVGNFHVTASGVGKGDFEVENAGSANGEYGVTARYSFTGDVLDNHGSSFVPNLDGHMNGTLSLTISWPGSTGFSTTTFKPDCMAELQTDPGGVSTGSFETEIEGWVSNFPGFYGPQRAIVSLHSEFDPDIPGLTYAVSIELGTTCHELPQFPNETELGGNVGADTGLDSGRLKIQPSGITAGRGALPSSVTPGSNPCPSVEL